MPPFLIGLTRGSIFAKRYEIIEELGLGGMGKVYRVFDRKIDEEVALKLIRPEIVVDEKTIGRFRNELKFARKIVHKNVCRMFDINEEGNTNYITMEYVHGEDLRTFINRTGALNLKKAISVSKQVTEGLKEAHSIGILHRDLKPQNIMIDKNGNAKIMDFGIARSKKATGFTEAGKVVGTPSYMSPEQLDGKKVDERSDIYSLGIILFEMLTGVAPFEGEDPFSIAYKQKMEKPPNPHELNPLIPNELSLLILRCLEKNRESRIQNAGQLLLDLQKIETDINDEHKINFKARLKSLLSSKKFLFSVLASFLILCVVFVFRSIPNNKGLRWADKQAIPTINELIQKKDYISAFQLTRKVESLIPEDPRLARIWPKISRKLSIETIPQGGEVYIKSSGSDESEWIYLGRTPLLKIKIPLGALTWKIEKEEMIKIEEKATIIGNRVRFDISRSDISSLLPPLFEIQEILEDSKHIRIAGGTQHKISVGQTGRIVSIIEPDAEKDLISVGLFFVTKANATDSIIEVIEPQREISKSYLAEFDEVPQAVLQIDSSPENADVFVNNEYKGKSELKLILPPDKYQIKLRKNNFLDQLREVELKSGSITQVKTSLSQIPPQFGEMVIQTNPPNAKIYIGDSRDPSGFTPFRNKLPPGRYKIRISLDYYKDETRVALIKSGKLYHESFELKPAAVELNIESEPQGADVHIDDTPENKGKTPLSLYLFPGSYKIKVSKAGFEEVKDSITVEPGPSFSKKYSLKKFPEQKYDLYIKTIPEDAFIYINERKYDQKKPFKLQLSTPHIKLRVECKGYQTEEENLTLNANKSTIKNYHLRKLGKGFLRIESFKRAWVSVDGAKLVNPVPPIIERYEVSEGSHIIRFIFDENLFIEKSEIIEPDQKKTVRINEEEYKELLAQKCMYQLSSYPGVDCQVDGIALDKITPSRKEKWLNEGTHRLKFILPDRIDIILEDTIKKGNKKRVHIKQEEFSPQTVLPSELTKKPLYQELFIIKSDADIVFSVDDNPIQAIQSSNYFPVYVTPGAYHKVLLEPDQIEGGCKIEVFFLNAQKEKFIKIDLDLSRL
jgi:serine/threonine protein kinase